MLLVCVCASIASCHRDVIGRCISRFRTINSAGDAGKAMAAITMAVANGELTPNEAAELSRVVDGYVKALEATEIERRIQTLEERTARDAK